MVRADTRSLSEWTREGKPSATVALGETGASSVISEVYMIVHKMSAPYGEVGWYRRIFQDLVPTSGIGSFYYVFISLYVK